MKSYDCPKSFGQWVVKKLSDAGFQALFAGGCVRDELLGLQPKDFDVATAALPEQVREVFGRKKTIAIGQSFGVITVIGNAKVGNVEVATFRCDGNYSDGRRPDEVVFTDARNDALRRDFTINGLFLDPLTDQVLDFVEGQEDLQRRVIRAIGNPVDRFNEDKLRMLRAVRFATTLQFQLEQATADAVIQHAPDIVKVSGERIAAEMLKLLQSSGRSQGLSLLLDCQLGDWVLPELSKLDDEVKIRVQNVLGQTTDLRYPVETTLSLLFWLQAEQESESPDLLTQKQWQDRIRPLVQRWKLSNRLRDAILANVRDVGTLLKADTLPWSEVQPRLTSRWASWVLEFAEIMTIWTKCQSTGVEFCKEKLQLPADELDPPPLLTGSALQEIGVPKGPEFGQLMNAIRANQLDKKLLSKDQATEFAKAFLHQQAKKS